MLESDRRQFSFNVTTLSGPRCTLAVTLRRVPFRQIAASESASRFLTHCESARTVLTVTRRPARNATTGTGRTAPERRPVVSKTTSPKPRGRGEPNPACTTGSTARFRARNPDGRRSRNNCTMTSTLFGPRMFLHRVVRPRERVWSGSLWERLRPHYLRPKPKSCWATLRIWISSEPSVMR